MGRRRWRTLRQTALVVTMVAIGALIVWLFFIHWHPSFDDYPHQGLDVSQAQGQIDWVAVQQGGAEFAYVRATQSATDRDLFFEDNWRGAFEAGMQRGAYLEYSLCQLAADQANKFNSIVPNTQDALPPAVFVDFKADCPARPERRVVVGEIARLMTLIENHMGKPALLKVSSAFEARYQLSAAIPRGLWETGNFFPPDYATRPWRMWQANDRRRIEGVAAPVHWSVVAK